MILSKTSYVLAAVSFFSLAAAAKETLVIYAPHPENLVEDVASKFEEETNIQVEFLHMGSGAVVERIRAEKENPQADVIFGGTSFMAIELGREGTLEPYTPAWADKVDDAYLGKYWSATQITPQVIFYNEKNMSEEDAPKKWSDLADPKYKDMIALRDPITSGTMQTFFASFMYDDFEKNGNFEESMAFLKGFDDNVKKYVNHSTLMFKAVAQDEVKIGLWNISGAYDNISRFNMPFKIVIPKEGVPAAVDIVALIKGAKNSENAKKFIDFIGSEKMQAYQAEKFSRVPTMKSALANAPKWMQQDFNVMDVDWEVISDNRKQWFENWMKETGKQ